MPGRNAPCPCGSGKKYKKCCAHSVAVNSGASQASALDQAIHNFENGDFPNAVAAARSCLKSNRNEPMCWQVLGVSLYYLGDFKAAEDAFREVVKRDKQNPDAWNNLGLVLYEQSLFDEATSSCRRALKLKPDMPGALNNLGNICRDQANYEQAENYYKRAIEVGMPTAEVFCNLGAVQQEQGRPDDAEQSYFQALKQEPTFVPAMSNLAAQQLEKGDLDKAKSWLDQAHNLDPVDPDLLCNLGQYWKASGNYNKAASWFNKALEQNPGHLMSLVGLGEILYEQSQLNEAKQYYDKIVEAGGLSDPHAAKAYCRFLIGSHRYQEVLPIWESFAGRQRNTRIVQTGLADYYIAIGNFDTAASVYASYLEKNPDDSVILFEWSVMEESRHNLETADDLARELLELDPNHAQARLIRVKIRARKNEYKEALNEIDKINFDADIYAASNILYERSAILDKLKRYDEAFIDLQKACELKNELLGSTYDKQREQQYLEEIKKVFSRENKHSLPCYQVTNDEVTLLPIFIVGFPRSGTTLVEQILASHSAVSAGDELSFIDELKNEISLLTGSKKAFPQNLIDYDFRLDQDIIIKLREYYFRRVKEKGVLVNENSIFTDKLPHNLLNLGLISLLFPESAIVHITRHPLDACLSAYMANFGYGTGHRYTSSLGNTATHYAYLMQLAEYYKSSLDMNYLEIRYEDIVTEPETKIRELVEFVGLPWQDACLDFHQTKRVSTTASYAQVTQKIYTSSRFRYKNYYEQMMPYAEILTEAMNRFGYTFEP